VVRVILMVRVSIRVYVMILFCRSIALFFVFYIFRIYIPHFTLYTYPVKILRRLSVYVMGRVRVRFRLMRVSHPHIT